MHPNWLFKMNSRTAVYRMLGRTRLLLVRSLLFHSCPSCMARKQSNISLWLLGVIHSLSAQGWRKHPGTPQAAVVVIPKTNKWRREKEAQTVTAGKERKTGKTGGRIIFMKCLLWASYFLRTLKCYSYINPIWRVFLSPLITDILGCLCNNYFSPFFPYW